MSEQKITPGPKLPPYGRSITLAVRPRNVDRYDPNKTEE